jgi:hypothetical protein
VAPQDLGERGAKGQGPQTAGEGVAQGPGGGGPPRSPGGRARVVPRLQVRGAARSGCAARRANYLGHVTLQPQARTLET